MAPHTLVAPLVSGSTYRRAVYLLLGGVVLLPYVLLAWAFLQLPVRSTQLPVLALLLSAAVLIAGAPAFLRGTRTLETVAARSLLDVDLTDLSAHKPTAEARLRSALWFAIHLSVGGVVGVALLSILPVALVFVTAQVGVGAGAATFRLGPLDGDDKLALSAIGVVLLIALVYAVAGLGRLAAMMAPVLLGPSPAERIAALEAQAGQLAERNRLARELHDSVGHALTVTTLQAAAAREVLDSDAEFVRRALSAVEETGRAAMADLDHVLGLLRDGDRADVAQPRTLADVDELIAAARTAGTEVTVEVTGETTGIPGIISREAYRVLQESLTNATRHASGQPVSLHLARTDATLTLEVVNAVRGEPATSRSGRGLTGMRERVALLGGRITAGRDDEAWRVLVRLPLGSGRGWRPT